MNFKVEKNKLEGTGINHVDTEKKSKGKLDPKFIVIHYTASDNYEGDVKQLSTSDAAVSCQLVLGPKGELTQVGDFTDILWHAGVSEWKGFVGLNKYAIGIEVVSPGPVDLVREKPNAYKTWTGKIIDSNSGYNFVKAKHKNGGSERWWAGFTAEQIEVLKELVPFLQKEFKIKEVVGHDDITKIKDLSGKVTGSRKIDPGPCMPEQLWALFQGRSENQEIIQVDENPKIEENGTVKTVQTPDGSKLNVRSKPNGEIIGSIPFGYKITEIKKDNNWSYIKTPNGNVGWAFSSYLV